MRAREQAFNTSGGLGTLTETLAGKVRDMSDKTLRYSGHAAPLTRKDVVVVFVTGIGEKAARLEEHSMVLRYNGTLAMSAIQLSTDAGCVAVVELFLAGKLPQQGSCARQTL